MRQDTPNALYGAFLVIPLKYDSDTFSLQKLREMGRPFPVTTMDLNENIKAMFQEGNPVAVGSGYAIDQTRLTAFLGHTAGADSGASYQVCE